MPAKPRTITYKTSVFIKMIRSCYNTIGVSPQEEITGLSVLNGTVVINVEPKEKEEEQENRHANRQNFREKLR